MRRLRQTDEHHPECEDGTHFLCHCGEFILAGEKSRNWCTACGKFAPHNTVCVCEQLDARYFDV